MNDLLFQIVSVLVSGMGVSVGLTDIIRRLIQKGKQSEPDISEKIEKVSTVLSQSSGELANSLRNKMLLAVFFDHLR